MWKSLTAVALMLIGMSAGAAPQPKIVTDALQPSEWIAKALSSSGYKADFSIASLKEIDRFFDEQSDEGIARPGGLLSTQLGTRVFALGSYVGEVMRRECGGSWSGDDADPDAEINLALAFPNGGKIWPVQRVMARFKNGDEDGIYAYGAILKAEYCK